MLGKLSTIGFLILAPMAVYASEIRQRPYGYSIDVAQTLTNDAFVVCANSADDLLSRLPVQPPLAVRLSRDEPGQFRSLGVQQQQVPLPKTHRKCVSCIEGTVNFPLDSSEITQKECSGLDELIRGIPAGATVNLDGYTCDIGTATHNRTLSFRRAEAVAVYLKSKGISVGNVNGHGDCCPVSDDRTLNRRVEISTQKKEEK